MEITLLQILFTVLMAFLICVVVGSIGDQWGERPMWKAFLIGFCILITPVILWGLDKIVIWHK